MLQQAIDDRAARGLDADFDLGVGVLLLQRIDPLGDLIRGLFEFPVSDLSIGCDQMEFVILIGPVNSNQDDIGLGQCRIFGILGVLLRFWFLFHGVRFLM